MRRSAVLDKIERGLSEDALLHPGWMDDRYAIGLTLDYLHAFLALSKEGKKK